MLNVSVHEKYVFWPCFVSNQTVLWCISPDREKYVLYRSVYYEYDQVIIWSGHNFNVHILSQPEKSLNWQHVL